ncbi:hypothetical protein Godav_000841 [Gossypium davidsonii]|uniref:Uncharacterized protein n=1 Tax=Gossypium davidsonii TaxID=34287 RepID=A0A7J8T106_GOSDV|nr:hypothetical protein [Gossypium davidsonii]
MMVILVQTGLKKVVTRKNPSNEYDIVGGIDGEDLIHLVEKVRNSLCD